MRRKVFAINCCYFSSSSTSFMLRHHRVGDNSLFYVVSISFSSFAFEVMIIAVPRMLQ